MHPDWHLPLLRRVCDMRLCSRKSQELGPSQLSPRRGAGRRAEVFHSLELRTRVKKAKAQIHTRGLSQASCRVKEVRPVGAHAM